jgi:hypothetical protein
MCFPLLSLSLLASDLLIVVIGMAPSIRLAFAGYHLSGHTGVDGLTRQVRFLPLVPVP